MAQRIPWDKYEVAVLIDASVKVINKDISQKDAVKEVSTKLRKKAINSGIKIDEIYRNENGISMQMNIIIALLLNKKSGLHNASKLFTEIVSIYKTDIELFSTILREANRMIVVADNEYKQYSIISTDKQSSIEVNPELDYYNYLKNEVQLSIRTCDAYVSSIRSSERYASDHGYKSSILFSSNRDEIVATAKELYSDAEFVNYNDEHHNRFSAAINKLLHFIGAKIPQKVRGISSFTKPDRKIENDSKVDSGIVEVMNGHYQYGFKIDSIRELMRFRQFAEAMGVSVPDNDDELIASIKAAGSLIDGKVFCKSDDLPNELKKIVDSIISEGINVIYYSKLFDLHNEWMTSHVITSPEMLKEYLQRHITDCYFAKTFFVTESKKTERNSVTAEIIRVWGESQTRTVESLSNELSYIPIENIWRVISGNDYFVLVEEGTYFYIEKLIINEQEIKDIQEYVDNAIKISDFASLNEIPLGDIEEENYEIPYLPLLNALYKRILSDDYKLNGSIMTKDGKDLNAVLLLKKSLADKEQCTFDELNEELIRLTGRVNRQYTFQALYDEMIRVDKNLFVSNRKVRFSISEIDEVISGFISDNFISLKEITNFAMFPVCGSSWNHFVLESFCYKYSLKYSLHTIHFNDKNVGIIAEKDYDKKYDDMLAIAIARADIDLNVNSIGQYLFDTGYLSKAKYAPLDRIIEDAKQIRRER